MSSDTVPTPITDKNGKRTTVHKKVGASKTPERAIPSVTPKAPYVTTLVPVGDYYAGTSFDGNLAYATNTPELVTILAEEPYLINSGRKSATKVTFSLDRGARLAVDLIDKSALNEWDIADSKDSMNIVRGDEGWVASSVYNGFPLAELASLVDDNWANTTVGKEKIIEGYVYGRYGARLVTGNDDSVAISIPSRSGGSEFSQKNVVSTLDIGLFVPVSNSSSDGEKKFIQDRQYGLFSELILDGFGSNKAG